MQSNIFYANSASHYNLRLKTSANVGKKQQIKSGLKKRKYKVFTCDTHVLFNIFNSFIRCCLILYVTTKYAKCLKDTFEKIINASL